MSERILVTRLRYIGDVVLTTPCIRRLREGFPRAEITYLTQTPYGDLLEENPFLSRVISADLPSLGARDSLKLMLELRRARYDLAVDLFSNPRSALLTASTLAKRRVGTYHLGRSWAYNVNVRIGPEIRSAVDHHLEHLKSLGVGARSCLPELFVTADEKKEGERIMKASGVAIPGKTVVIQPGAKWRAKQWPAERFGELSRLLKRESFEVALLAGPGEEPLLEESLRAQGQLAVLQELSLREMMKVLSACAGYVGNDGGPAHVAAALGTPTVALFGPSEPDIWFPYSAKAKAICVHHDIQCRPCHLHECESIECLRSISPSEVMKAVTRVLSA